MNRDGSLEGLNHLHITVLLERLAEAGLQAAGIVTKTMIARPRYERFRDPFGNRMGLIRPALSRS